MTILVTGGAGFIGLNFIRHFMKQTRERVINVDNLSYAANINDISALEPSSSHFFVKADICDAKSIRQILNEHQPRAIINFAAETHVDNSIMGPKVFIDTNIFGTYNLLETSRSYWSALTDAARERFLFIQISTDEVYGSISYLQYPVDETAPFLPRNPYSASKASADHIARAYYHTYSFPTIVTHCSSNFGPYQFPEKLIPLTIAYALTGKKLPLYGDGLQTRDWIHVLDHCDALMMVLEKGKPGDVFNIGANAEMTNIDVVNCICEILDELHPKRDQTSYNRQIEFVTDRLGHDRRYSIDPSRIRDILGWQAKRQFKPMLRETIKWYLERILAEDVSPA